MLGFLFKLAGIQIAANVIGNSLSGQPLFSGFFSDPAPRYKQISKPVTEQTIRNFIKWAIGSNTSDEFINTMDFDLDYVQEEFLFSYNNRWRHVLYLNPAYDFASNFKKMWNFYDNWQFQEQKRIAGIA